MILDWLLDADEPDEDYETYEEREEFELTAQFIRRTVRYQFVRGDEMQFTYDVFDGRVSIPDAKRRVRVEDGKRVDERGEIRVERFCEVTSGHPVWSDGENILQLRGELTGVEVTTANVNVREVIAEDLMEAVLPVYVERTYRADTDKQVSSWTVPHKIDEDADIEIRPVTE